MEKILDKIISNNVLFACVIIVLSAILITLIILIIRSMRENKKINIYEEELEDEDIKKVKSVKKEDIIESPEDSEEITKEEKIKIDDLPTKEELEAIDEEEIKERYDEENEKEIEELLNENAGSEIEVLIKEMEDSSKVKPEDVVANFEKEQEAQSIISYKELVDAVKNRQEEYYEDELESVPLATVSDFVKEKKEELKTEDIIKEMAKDIAVKPQEDIEKVEVNDKKEEYEENKFRKTEIISPVFGRINPKEEDNFNMDDIDLGFDDSTAFDEVDGIYQHMADDLKKNSENDTAVLDDLTKNEEFLQSLKDFRKKL